MRRTALLVFAVVAWSTASAFAYTQEDTSACMSDAFRLCSASIPDAGEVARCLYAKRRHLSRPCAAAFARYGQQSARRHQQVSRD